MSVTLCRIIVFLNTWIEKYPEDFREPKMAELISAFDVLATSSSNEKEAYSIEATLAKSLAKKVSPLTQCACSHSLTHAVCRPPNCPSRSAERRSP
jgi:hypothetical protein